MKAVAPNRLELLRWPTGCQSRPWRQRTGMICPRACQAREGWIRAVRQSKRQWRVSKAATPQGARLGAFVRGRVRPLAIEVGARRVGPQVPPPAAVWVHVRHLRSNTAQIQNTASLLASQKHVALSESPCTIAQRQWRRQHDETQRNTGPALQCEVGPNGLIDDINLTTYCLTQPFLTRA